MPTQQQPSEYVTGWYWASQTRLTVGQLWVEEGLRRGDFQSSCSTSLNVVGMDWLIHLSISPSNSLEILVQPFMDTSHPHFHHLNMHPKN